jgi:hypothetical protein
MKLSDLIEILEFIKKDTGDKAIWDIDCFSWNMPDKIEIELANNYEKTDSGSQCTSTDGVTIYCDYDSDLGMDRSIKIEKGE